MSINPIQDVLEAVGLESITPPDVAVLTHLLSAETTHAPPREKEPRELAVDETAMGKIVAHELDRAGDARYVMQSEQGERIAIAVEEGMDFSLGEEIEVTRTAHGYDVADRYDYGR